MRNDCILGKGMMGNLWSLRAIAAIALMQTQGHFADHRGEAHWPGLLLASSLYLALAKGTAIHLTAECCPGCLVIFEACLALVLLAQLQTVSGKKRQFPYEIVLNEHRAHERRAHSSKEFQGYLVTS